MNATKSLAIADQGQLAAFAARDRTQVAGVIELLKVERNISAFDLTRVRVPTGGGMSWEIPTLEGDTTEKTFDAIILGWRDTRSYWDDPNPAGAPPDCSSDDAEQGRGMFGPGSERNRTGSCDTCPMAQFGSKVKVANGAKGAGQACKFVRQLFLLQPDGLLPTLLFIPPSSLKPFKQYVMRLASGNVAFYAGITTFGLVKAQSKDNIAYAQVLPTLAVRIPSDEMAWINEYREAVLPNLMAATRGMTDGDDIWDADAEELV